MKGFFVYYKEMIEKNLESTDVTPEVPHPHPTRLPARWSAFVFFFSWIHADLAWFAPNRADSARIGPYRLAAETGRNWPWIWPEKRKLAFFFFFLFFLFFIFIIYESRHSNVFFKNILIVKIYRKYCWFLDPLKHNWINLGIQPSCYLVKLIKSRLTQLNNYIKYSRGNIKNTKIWSPRKPNR